MDASICDEHEYNPYTVVVMILFITTMYHKRRHIETLVIITLASSSSLTHTERPNHHHRKHAFTCHHRAADFCNAPGSWGWLVIRWRLSCGVLWLCIALRSVCSFSDTKYDTVTSSGPQVSLQVRPKNMQQFFGSPDKNWLESVPVLHIIRSQQPRGPQLRTSLASDWVQCCYSCCRMLL